MDKPEIIEMKCPVCGSYMKEYVTKFNCRNRCGYSYEKYFKND